MLILIPFLYATFIIVVLLSLISPLLPFKHPYNRYLLFYAKK